MNLAKGTLDALFVVLIWSGFVLISRIGGKSELLSYDVAALRFGTAALVLLPYWALKNKTNLLNLKLITAALIGGVGYCTIVYFGFRFAPATHAGILLPGLLPFEATIFSWLILGEKPAARRIAGLGVIALGVAALAVETMNAGFEHLPGDIAFVCAGTLWALYAALVKKWQISPWDATVGCALISAIAYLPVYAAFLPKHMVEASWSAIGLQAFYQGVMAMVVAMIFYMRAMKALGPTKIGLFMALVPVISGLAAVPLLGEDLTPLVIAGLALTALGACLASRG